MRRLTELDLDQLPATGASSPAAGVRRRARDGDVPPLRPAGVGHSVAEVVADLQAGPRGEGPLPRLAACGVRRASSSGATTSSIDRRRLARARDRVLPRARTTAIRNVAVLEQSYIGSGAAGRNTTIIRSNYRTPEGAEFYRRSVELYEQLSGELDFNLMFSQHGHLTLAHSDRVAGHDAGARRGEPAARDRLPRRRARRDRPALPASSTSPTHPTWPIMGALYHAPGGIIRHDAVVWGFARGADRGGVEIHQNTKVTGIERTGGRVTAVETNRGRVAADRRQRDAPAGRRSSAAWRASGSRSRRTSCRRSSPSR